jgi:predicted DNA-binding protein (UPF0251 family)
LSTYLFTARYNIFQAKGNSNDGSGGNNISLDEYEAIRLKDYENLDQESAAVKMGISQPTFYRLISSAHKKIADALINGKAMKIEGGNIEVCKEELKNKST